MINEENGKLVGKVEEEIAMGQSFGAPPNSHAEIPTAEGDAIRDGALGAIRS